MTADEHTAFSVLLGYHGGLKRRVTNSVQSSCLCVSLTGSLQGTREMTLLRQ
jgi:hypothetical protein